MFDSISPPTVIRDDSARARPALLRPARRARRTLRDFERTFGAERIHDEAMVRDREVVLNGLACASLDVARGDLFVALPGAHAHGARYAAAAAAAGASAIVTDLAGADLACETGLPTLVVDDPRGMLAMFSAWLYGSDADAPTLLGVTGTNGKTSTVHMLHGILSQMGVHAGLSTTVERRIGGRAVASRLTTPEAPELHALLESMREAGASAVALEVSAHGVSRGRVDGLMFDVVGFTNLTHDHLDEYGGMEDYFDAKVALFRPEHARRAVVSVDTEYGERLRRLSGIPVTTITTQPDIPADWRVRVTRETPESTWFTLSSTDGRMLQTRVSLMGVHMAADAGLAIVMLLEAGFSLQSVSTALESTGLHVHVPGRGERVSGDRGPLVLLDFSHNGDAFEKTLLALRRVTGGSVVMVVGADGDKDPTKRAHMGRVSAACADILIITDHHPRHEDPAAIRAALRDGAASVPGADSADVYEIANPRDAIRAAIALAGPGDSILWAGPGLTDYRIVGADRVPYSPHRDTRVALREAGWL
ncbi:Mur ligase family protein [Microbacterium sp. P02]|uniref:Mur ligase family protein n=1 Tax=Microbacterium sp. P02 TaxID=3366260 RepID=UPI00366A6C0F